MMSSPLSISIVTPSFNQGAYLEAAIRSVLSQNYPALQYVIMDGGSTDGSLEIIERHRHDLFHASSGVDAGQYDAINRGFALTDAPIMGWLNSDDMHMPWTLSIVGEIFTTFPDVQWLTTRFPIRWDARGLVVACRDVGGYSKESILSGDNLPGNGLPGAWPIQQESTFWRRSLWESAGGFLDTRLSAAADYDLWLRFSRLADIVSVGVPLAGFRRHGEQKTFKALDAYQSQAQKAFARSRGMRSSRLRRILRVWCRERLPYLFRPFAQRAGLLHPTWVCERSRDNTRWLLSSHLA